MVSHSAVDTEDIAAGWTRCHGVIGQDWTLTGWTWTVDHVGHCVQRLL